MWENTLYVVIGGVLSVGGSMAAQWFTNYLDGRRSRRTLAGAFAGEVGAICSIIRRRKYVETAEQFFKQVCESPELLRLEVNITQEYFVIYHAQAGNIGFLPASQAMNVVEFYTQAKAIMEDVVPNASFSTTTEEAIVRLQTQIEMMTELLKLGDGLVKDLQDIARQSCAGMTQ